MCTVTTVAKNMEIRKIKDMDSEKDDMSVFTWHDLMYVKAGCHQKRNRKM